MKTKPTPKSTKSNRPEIFKEPSLVGCFFHQIKDEKVGWQGVVVGRPEPGLYLVQLFEWLMGEPNVRRLVKVEDMANWLFYEDGEQMVHSYDYGVAKRHRHETRKELEEQQG
jgi:hypothetical protein